MEDNHLVFRMYNALVTAKETLDALSPESVIHRRNVEYISRVLEIAERQIFPPSAVVAECIVSSHS